MRNDYQPEQIENLQYFGRYIRDLRNKLGLSQEKMAELAMLNRNYLGEVERGERNISLLNIIQLSKAFDVPVRDLFPEDL